MPPESSLSTAARLRITAPFDGEEIAEVDITSPKQLEHCLATADLLSRDRSAWLPPAERVGILERAARLLLHDRLSIAMTAAHEGGKPLLDSEIEVEQAIDTLKLCAEHVRRSGDHAVPAQIGTSYWGAITRGEPVGVVVARTAFHHPVNLVAHQIAPAVAAGCPVIVAPTPSTPLSCLELARILRTAGLPADWCQVVISTDPNTVPKLVTDPRVRYCSFSGTRDEGARFRSMVANGTRSFIARDGDAIVVVLDEATRDLALENVLKGGYYHAGQTLVRLREVLVPNEQVDAFAQALAGRAEGLRLGNPKSADTEIGPLLRDADAALAEKLVRSAVDDGATVLSGGQRRSATVLEPTVLLDASAPNGPAREVSGPVVRIRGYRSLREAAQASHALPRLVAALVFTRDYDRAFSLYPHFDAEVVAVNAAASAWIEGPALGGLRDAATLVQGPCQMIEQMRAHKTLLLQNLAHRGEPQ